VPIDSKHTAVVLIEFQNDLTSDGGALHAAELQGATSAV
jgi:nicotinamidase-related amidase